MLYNYIRWQLPSNQGFYRQVVGCGMIVGDHTAALLAQGTHVTARECHMCARGLQ